MKIILTLLLLAGSAGADHVPLDDKPQLQIVRLLWRYEQQQSMASYCRQWAEKYRNAYTLSDRAWNAFQRDAPRHIGNGKPYDVEYDEQAAEHEAKAKALWKEIEIAGKRPCPSGFAVGVDDGVVYCMLIRLIPNE